MRSKKIGIFDSGFGGLTILSGIKKILPDYDYIYLGDTARAPYGSRPQNEIYKFSSQAVDYLFKEGCEIIIFACNTASAEALRKIQQEYLPKKYPEKKVLGVIIPAAEWIFENYKPKSIGVIGTQGTIESNSFFSEIKKINNSVNIIQSACPLLVPIIENGEYKSPKTNVLLKKYLVDMIDNVDILILGCTHYEIIIDEISKIMGPQVIIAKQSVIIGDKLKKYFDKHPEIENLINKNNKIDILTTGKIREFKFFSENILDFETNPKKVKIG